MSYRPLLRYSYRIPSSSLHTPSSFASSVVYIYPLYYQRYYSSSSSSSSSLFVRTTKNGRRVQLLPTSSSSFTTQIIPRRTFVSRPSGYSYRDRLPINFVSNRIIRDRKHFWRIERKKSEHNLIFFHPTEFVSNFDLSFVLFPLYEHPSLPLRQCTCIFPRSYHCILL
jgi:hypothetical protein